jgi:hypothetical protein
MKVRVRFEIADRSIDETVEACGAEELLAIAKARVARELGWKGLFLNAMTPLSFAQMAVQRYNDHYKAHYPIPKSAEEFVEFGEATGNLTVLEA